MATPASEHMGDRLRLRVKLADALVEADKCDSIVAVHIETALAVLDQQVGAQPDIV